MSTFWSLWVVALVVITIVGCCWVLFANRKVEIRAEREKEEGRAKTGHIYDGIEEYDNPLPRWWFNLFVATVIFAVVYLILYPGLGNFQGLLGWSSSGELKADVAAAEERYGPIFEQYGQVPVKELAADPQALKIGRRLFANNCALCHGTDGRGSYGFPNLADDAWLYGGSPEAIKTSIVQGRNGMMPGWGNVIGEAGVTQVAEYVFRLSGRPHDADLADKGKSVYATYCASCHSPDGKGSTAMGAPDLTDDAWLYGSSPRLVKHSIRNGRSGNMPAHGELIGEDRIHLLTAYVYSLSQR
jgi:cytochrome c oxidase cbb3-type subunit 3